MKPINRKYWEYFSLTGYFTELVYPETQRICGYCEINPANYYAGGACYFCHDCSPIRIEEHDENVATSLKNSEILKQSGIYCEDECDIHEWMHFHPN